MTLLKFPPPPPQEACQKSKRHLIYGVTNKILFVTFLTELYSSILFSTGFNRRDILDFSTPSFAKSKYSYISLVQISTNRELLKILFGQRKSVTIQLPKTQSTHRQTLSFQPLFITFPLVANNITKRALMPLYFVEVERKNKGAFGSFVGY
jgi:hypothetical protein